MPKEQTAGTGPSGRDHDGLTASDWLPGPGIHLLAGSPYAGKTTLYAGLLRAIERGGPFLDLPIPTSYARYGVIMTDRLEEDAGSWLRKFNSGAKVISYKGNAEYTRMVERKEWGQDWPHFERFKWGLTRLAEMWGHRGMVDLPKCSTLLVVDVFGYFFQNLHDDTSTYDHLDLYYDLCQRYGITLLGLTYGVKIQGDRNARYPRIIDRIKGGSAIRGGTGSMMYVPTPEEALMDGKGYQTFTVAARSIKGELVIPIIREPDGFFRKMSSWECNAATAAIQENKTTAAAVKLLGLFPEGQPIEARVVFQAYLASEGLEESQKHRNRFDKWVQRLREGKYIDQVGRGIYRKAQAS